MYAAFLILTFDPEFDNMQPRAMYVAGTHMTKRMDVSCQAPIAHTRARFAVILVSFSPH